MKTRIVLILSVVCLSFFSFNTINQDLKTALVTYDGYEYEMYNFSISGGDDEADVIIAFNEIPENILKEYDLKSEKLIGENFEITYQVAVEEGEEEGDAEEEYILKSLKKVKK